MRHGKRLATVGMLVALALLSIPALATAAVWKDNHANVTSPFELTLKGSETFLKSEGNGMLCEIEAKLTGTAGSTGTITEWSILQCPTGFGTFYECGLATAEAKGLPWTVTVNAGDLTITNMRVKRTFTGCTQGELDKTIASTTVPLITPATITEMEFTGTNGTYKSFGGFYSVTPSGRYGIG